ncbi:efflux RND transporter permease subunit [Candidatus Methylacidithermus pantelleriae]|uniref:Cation efflux system protein CzcA n=1 Tax=Candidatus Methylacidithermus pantelleriae TaxID=2744239 RepID=A0A8J2BUF7_9BACT|nr:CusA/CzcA family heavy metal efflux RND transporter [Candidatus Methylacidithermus pantelleriae]CAF0700039.1 Cation efflux system protein CzcA [Candidatus Methylacidithermus pantelleriae]
MIRKTIEICMDHPGVVLAGVGLLLLLAAKALVELPIDAVPDITPVQVQVNVYAPSLAPEEVEQLVTMPLEQQLSGVPNVESMRSLSRFGLSQVTLVFREGTDVYRSRQLVSERLVGIGQQLPEGTELTLGPLSGGLGEIFYYVLRKGGGGGEQRVDGLMQLRLLQEFMVRPFLRETPGIADVNTSGGYEKQVLVMPDPGKLLGAGISVRELVDVVGKNVANAGGGVVRRGGEGLYVRSVGRVLRTSELEQIRWLPVKWAGKKDRPIVVGDVAGVGIGWKERLGAATENGTEAVLGTALMLLGENSREVAQRVKQKVTEIQQRLPPGVEIRGVYDRSEVVDRTIATVERNLAEGALLVSAVLVLLLGHGTGAVLVVTVLVLAFLFALVGMRYLGISGNLMSLGAIDFGLLVDGAVVLVENSVRRLAEVQQTQQVPLSHAERRRMILEATSEVAPSIFFGILIITVVYFPVLALGGIEGKMFRPMAFTVILALSGAIILTATYVPVGALLFLRRGKADSDTWPIRILRRAYEPVLGFALHKGIWVVAGALLLGAGALWLLPRLGAEFVPRLDEGSFVLMVYKTKTISLDESLELEQKAERVLLAHVPEVDHVFSRIGTSDIATDPMLPNESDLYIMLKPRSSWRRENGNIITKDRLSEIVKEEIQQRVPGLTFLVGQPIEDRFNEILQGLRADVVVKIFGEDYDVLQALGEKVAKLLKRVPGIRDAEISMMGRNPVLEFVPNRKAMMEYGVQLGDLNEAISVGLGGRQVGTLLEGFFRVPMVVRLSERDREDVEKVLDLPIRTPQGGLIPLRELGSFRVVQRVRSIWRERLRRVFPVLVNLSTRDVGGVVREAQKVLERDIRLPAGYVIEFGGEFRYLQETQARLRVLVPVTLLVVFLLTVLALGSVRQALMVFMGVPFGAIGGVFSLAAAGVPFSVSAAVGFIAVSGVAVLAGLVLISFFNELRKEGLPLSQAIWLGCRLRLRPIVMTATVASLGFLPMALASGMGSEVQKPLATVVIGGIVSSTALSLLLLPVFYQWVESLSERWLTKKGVQPSRPQEGPGKRMKDASVVAATDARDNPSVGRR